MKKAGMALGGLLIVNQYLMILDMVHLAMRKVYRLCLMAALLQNAKENMKP